MRSLTVILGCLTVAATCPAQTPNWTQIRPNTSGSARTHHAIAYDSARQRAVLFGGSFWPGNPLGDTWEWNGRIWMWTNPTTPPPARAHHAMVYDSIRQRTVLFGGLGSSLLSDTWEWDGRIWTKMNPATSPPARQCHAMVYDSVRQRTVLFGGTGRFVGSDTWEWNGRNWTRTNPTTSPSARARHAMVYDSVRQRTVLFGGWGVSSVFLSDTWEWNGRNWTKMNPTTSPSARLWHAMAFDSARQRTVLYGGTGLSGSNNTWEWDGRNWTKMNTTPSPRTGHAMVYDSARQRTVLHGGELGFGRLLGDTWEYGVPNLTLTATPPTISIANGGTQTLSINAGSNLKNKLYWIFGSMTGTMPGVVLTGIHIPLRVDIYTDIAIVFVNSKEFKDFKRTLSATGTATASLNVPAKLPIPIGSKLYHAYVVYDGTTGQLFTSSNPVSVEFK